MQIIESCYAIMNHTADFAAAQQEIEAAARTCYKSEDRIAEESAEKLVKKLIASGHHAMLEFGPSIVVRFICDRGISHELVRHRLCSFAQESTRYCNYAKNKFGNQITYINPEFELDEEELEFMRLAESRYKKSITKGRTPQQARYFLLTGLKTEIVVKANIREWRHIFQQRTSRFAHPQMRQLMIPLLEEFKTLMPILFDDI